MKNLPEPEASFLKVTLVYKERTAIVLCDIYDFLDCDAVECALELFDSYIQRYVNASERKIVLISNTKGGKLFVYEVDGRNVCVCVHKADIDCMNICRGYLG